MITVDDSSRAASVDPPRTVVPRKLFEFLDPRCISQPEEIDRRRRDRQRSRLPLRAIHARTIERLKIEPLFTRPYGRAPRKSRNDWSKR